MLDFYKILKRILAVIPKSYKKTSIRFFMLSLVLLILDVFSIFLLIPLIISMLDKTGAINFINIKFFETNKYLLVSVVMIFFITKNFIAIRINKFQSNLVFKLGAEYSLLLSKYYLLGNYLDFKQQKKSAIIKDIIFVSNDFVGNVLLSINTIVSEIILLSFLSFIGFYYNYNITLLIVIILGCVIFIYKKHNQFILDKINRTRITDFDKNISNLNNLLNGYLSLKSSNMLSHFLAAFNKSNKTLNNSYAILHSKRLNSSKQTEIILVLLLCVFFIAINLFSLKGITPIVFLSIFASLLFKSIPSINKLNIAYTNLKSHLYTLDIIEEKTTKITKINSLNSAITFNHSITLKNICFSYEDKKEIINNLTFSINKGQFIGISGISGIGKTTLLNIIAKLINPTNGDIYIDDKKITEENKYQYFNLFTYLTQKPFIYEGSILDNLVLDNNKYRLEEILNILKAIKLDKVIDQLPQKLNTYIGTDAGNLSAGQLQRLCIVRALLSKPKILILDEATNNLDKKTEIEVLELLKYFALKNNTTIISVSHHINETKHLYDAIIELKITNEI